MTPDSIKVIHDNDMWDNDSEGAHITVVNYPNVDVPQTGDRSTGTVAGIIIGAGLSLFAALGFGGYIIARKRKENA